MNWFLKAWNKIKFWGNKVEDWWQDPEIKRIRHKIESILGKGINEYGAAYFSSMLGIAKPEVDIIRTMSIKVIKEAAKTLVNKGNKAKLNSAIKDLDKKVEAAGNKLKDANSKWVKSENSKAIIESVFTELKKIKEVQ